MKKMMIDRMMITLEQMMTAYTIARNDMLRYAEENDCDDENPLAAMNFYKLRAISEDASMKISGYCKALDIIFDTCAIEGVVYKMIENDFIPVVIGEIEGQRERIYTEISAYAETHWC